jgi:hypothetical protein
VRPDIRSACTAGRRSRNDIRRWPFKFFYFFLFFSQPAGAHQWHPNNLYGDAKESRHHIATANRAAGAVNYKQFRIPCRLHTIQ